MKSQVQLILEYVSSHGSITQTEAFKELGIGRLASRINDMRCLGYEIQTVPEEGVNRYGAKVRYGRYFVKVPNPSEPLERPTSPEALRASREASVEQGSHESAPMEPIKNAAHDVGASEAAGEKPVV